MLLPMFLASASPVMVLETQIRVTSKRECQVYFTADTVNSVNGPVTCRLRVKRRRNSRVVKSQQKMQEIIDRDPSLDFPFLRDPQTRKLFQRSKVLFIMRGLPGSGKSTVVKAITRTYYSSVVCSADDHFLRDGVYKFDAACLSSAHTACQNKAKDSCNAGTAVVIVDNTNVRRWEMKFYLELASHRDYVVVPVQPKTVWRWNPVELAARNKHGVDVETLKRKVTQFDDIVPVYYAWFLNEPSSKQLCFMTDCLLKECVQHFPALGDRLLKQLNISAAELRQHSDSTSTFTETLSGILKEYYTRGRRAGCLVHCTAKFCGGGRAVGAKFYHSQPAVQNSLGKCFPLEITSLCFSPRTVGARVKLADGQMPLFDKPEEKDWNGVQPHSPVSKDSGGARSEPKGKEKSPGAKGGGSSGQSKHSKGSKKKAVGSKQSDHESQPGTPVKRTFEAARTKPVAKGRGRSAHITLGCAQGFESRETNFDVLRLCDMEAESPGADADFVSVTGGRARYFGDGVCCVYFQPSLHVKTLYSGFY